MFNKKFLNKKLDSRLKDFLTGLEVWNPKFLIFTTPRMVADPLLHRVPESRPHWVSFKKSRVSTRAMVFLIQNVRCKQAIHNKLKRPFFRLPPAEPPAPNEKKACLGTEALLT